MFKRSEKKTNARTKYFGSKSAKQTRLALLGGVTCAWLNGSTSLEASYYGVERTGHRFLEDQKRCLGAQ